MVTQFNRRTVLKGLGAGAITLSSIGPVTAASDTRYIVTARGNGVRNRIERADFNIIRTLADGEVLYVEGTGSRDQLEAVDGVETVAEDQRFSWHGSTFQTETDPKSFTVKGNPPSSDEDLRKRQWDKEVTDIETAHETATGEGTTIAIVDGGIDTEHPAISNVDTEAGRRFKYGSVDSGTGDVQLPVDPFDLCKGTETIDDYVFDDISFHGTWVAGVAGANQYGKDDTKGVVGTAPDTTMVPLKVIWWDEFNYDCDGDGNDESAAGVGTTLGDILSAIDYAADIGADAINLSLGIGPLPPQANQTGIRTAYDRVIKRAIRQGSVVVASAGNAGANLQQGGFFLMPSSTPGAMSISATGPNDLATFYTNYGTNEVAVGAPGGGYETLEKTFCTEDGRVVVQPLAPYPPCTEDCDCTPPEYPYPYNGVLSPVPKESWLGEILLAGNTVNGGLYFFSGGTSASAPHVTGTVALIRDIAPDASPKQIEQAINHGADLVEGQNDPDLGAGRLNAADALDAPTLSSSSDG